MQPRYGREDRQATASRVRVMLDSALTLITLASLFIIGPAVGYAVV